MESSTSDECACGAIADHDGPCIEWEDLDATEQADADDEWITAYETGSRGHG